MKAYNWEYRLQQKIRGVIFGNTSLKRPFLFIFYKTNTLQKATFTKIPEATHLSGWISVSVFSLDLMIWPSKTNLNPSMQEHHLAPVGLRGRCLVWIYNLHLTVRDRYVSADPSHRVQSWIDSITVAALKKNSCLASMAQIWLNTIRRHNWKGQR